MIMYKKQTLIIAIFLSITILFLAVSPASANEPDLAEVGQFLDQQLRAQVEELNLPNAAVAVVVNGEIVYMQGYGYADIEASLPVEPDKTLFRVGSVAKLITWTAVMQLVEQGKLDLNADVNDYLDFQIPARLVGRSGTPEPVTLTHLLTHTPGFESYPDLIFRLSADHLLPLNEYVRLHLPARVFPPGQVPAYSNYGAALAGYIVERVSGQPFAQYVEQNIFAPLAMEHSTFRQPLPAGMDANLARSYRFVDGAFLEGGFEYMQEPEGSLSSTAADMAKFMIAHLGDGRYTGSQILSPETLRLMHSSQPSRHSELGGMTLGFMQGSFNGQPVLFHGGSTTVYDSGLYLLPQENVGLFVVYSGASHLAHTSLFQSFLDRYYPTSNRPDPAPPPGMLERSRRLAGEYHQNTRSFTTSESITSLVLGVINVAADEDGYLLVTHVGETNRFVEVEPGVYRSLREGRTPDYFGPFQTLVFETGPLGRTMLTSDGPMSYSRAPWYGSSMFTLPALILILLFMLVSLVTWSLGLAVGLFRGRRRTASPAPNGLEISDRASAARWKALARITSAAFALFAVLYLFGVVVSGLAEDPVYLLPPAAMGLTPTWVPLLDLLLWPLVILGLATALLTLVVWRNGFWRLPGRIHYTLFSGAALLLLWIFYYWKVF
jgi:CubicO group peptidase (beta-lactamase class C family)